MNLLFIHSHDLGQHLGCYGVDTVQTPNLDRLAASGARFRKHFCASPGCSPSRAALWTGRHAHRTGVHGLTHGNFMWDLNSDEKHLAAILAGHGYATALAGGYHETRSRPDAIGYRRWLNDDDFLGFVPAREVADSATAYLAERKGAEDPFFLSVGLFEPHRPFDYGGVAPDASQGIALPDWIPQDTEARKAAAEEEFAAIQGAVREMDAQVGRILDSLEQNGLADTTLVVFTSDHGLAVARAKCSLYDPGIEVPLLLRDPRQPEWRGLVREGLTSGVDVAPTLLDLLGLPAEPRMVDGHSLRPLLEKEHAIRESIFAEKSYHRDYDPIRCARTQTHKLIVNFENNTAYDAPSDILPSPIMRESWSRFLKPRDPVELYDLRADPTEQNNLAADPEHADLREELQARLRQWMHDTEDPLLDGPIRSRYDPWIKEQIGLMAID